MKKLISIYQSQKEVISYLFWGVMTTVLSYIIFAVLVDFTPLNYQVNNVISWIISALFAYFTNRKFVFHSTASTNSEYFKEFVSFMLGGRFGSLILQTIILQVGVSMLGGNKMIVYLISQVVVIVFNYFWSKLIAFKN